MATNQNDQAINWAVFLHLSLLLSFVSPVPFTGIVVPIVIWQAKKSQIPSLDAHGRNALNWIISSILYYIVCLVTVVGLLFTPILVGLGIVLPMIAAIKASNHQTWKYPLTLNILEGDSEPVLRRAGLALLSLSIVPLAGLLGTGFWANKQQQWLASLSPASGTVVQIREKTDEDGDTVYQPVIEFQDGAGEEHQLDVLWWSNPPAHQLGDRVDVLYSEGDPQTAIADRWGEKWFGIVLAFVVSLVLLVFSLIPSLSCWLLAYIF